MPLPSTSVPNLVMKANPSGSVSSPATNSKRRMKRTGLKKWVTKKFFLKSSERPSIISEMRSPDVLEVMKLPGLRCSSSLANRLRLMSRFSMITSITQSHSAMRDRSSSKLPVWISSASSGE
jgi:hypothetical protein